MDGWRAVLGPADVHAALIELDLMPLEITGLGGPQSMTVGDQDHGRVSMSVATVLAGIVHELFDFARGQIFPNCTVYSVWRAGIPCLIRHRKFRVVEVDWEDNTLFLYSNESFYAPAGHGTSRALSRPHCGIRR